MNTAALAMDRCASIETEIDRATSGEINAYLQGASRDGTFNRLHRTLRIAQADVRWLRVLGDLLGRLGKRSWTYREGTRSVWVIETTWRPESPATIRTQGEAASFVRGYFDAEGGVPGDTGDRFYVQFVQKNRADLAHTRGLLEVLGVQCGRTHNPSARRDANYWRFYVLAASHKRFIGTVGSWHPRKRVLLDERVISPGIVGGGRQGNHARDSGRTGLQDVSCRVFGHICPVFFVSAPLTETIDRRKHSRSIPRDVMLKVVRRDGQICQRCHEPMADNQVEFDHVISFSRGGTSATENLRLVHRDCNRDKRDSLDRLLAPDPLVHFHWLKSKKRRTKGSK